MKVRIIITLLVLTIFIFSGCEKQPDYRNKYLGNWVFETKSTTIKDFGTFYDTTLYHGEIKYGREKDEIFLRVTEYDSLTLAIDLDGKIKSNSFSPSPTITYSYTGGFEGSNKLQYLYHLKHASQTVIYNTINGEKE